MFFDQGRIGIKVKFFDRLEKWFIVVSSGFIVFFGFYLSNFRGVGSKFDIFVSMLIIAFSALMAMVIYSMTWPYEAARKIEKLVTKREVLHFRFGAFSLDDDLLLGRLKGLDKSNNFENEICEDFGATVKEALKGKLDVWAKTADGCVALLIVLKEFAPIVLRDQSKKLESAAALARYWERKGAKLGYPQQVPPMARILFDCLDGDKI